MEDRLQEWLAREREVGERLQAGAGWGVVPAEQFAAAAASR